MLPHCQLFQRVLDPYWYLLVPPKMPREPILLSYSQVDCLRVDCLRVDCLRVDCLRVDCWRVDCLRVDCLRVDCLQVHCETAFLHLMLFLPEMS